MHFSISLFLLVGLAARTALAQVQGTAPRFAAGTIGGGNASPQTPSSLEE
jgi:pectin lyase